MFVMKDQIRSLDLGETGQLYFYKYCLFNGGAVRMESWQNGGLPPEDEIKRTQLEGIGRSGLDYFKNSGREAILGASSEDGESQYCQKVIRDFVQLFGVFVVSDAIPMLKWLDINAYEKKMKTAAKKLDKLVEGWLEEHKHNRLLDGGGQEEEDFMDLMLTTLHDAEISCFDADTINKATCLNLIAASDSMKVALTWSLSLLLNNLHMLKNAQDELDIHVGRDLKESDIKNLVYLKAIMKETLRLYPPGAIIGLHASKDDCTLSTGYKIPTGTRLMVNLWKIHHDESVWPDPDKFYPESFLTCHKDIDVRGQNFELLPFCSGRQSCPAIPLALQVLHFVLAALLHNFEIASPSVDLVDMTMSTGMTNLKATPLEVLLIPHLKLV
ncbi:Cytochrome P450 [Quillaja saponaria]|uniref:Cytochrome P450 n=1 Tax=Quillaja saponaria TaxID=32244 RepID=A0AAD7LKX1_QUISA|nr:Cytochrome P450 [Quillaja saponaria]